MVWGLKYITYEKKCRELGLLTPLKEKAKEETNHSVSLSKVETSRFFKKV